MATPGEMCVMGWHPSQWKLFVIMKMEHQKIKPLIYCTSVPAPVLVPWVCVRVRLVPRLWPPGPSHQLSHMLPTFLTEKLQRHVSPNTSSSGK